MSGAFRFLYGLALGLSLGVIAVRLAVASRGGRRQPLRAVRPKAAAREAPREERPRVPVG